MANPYHKKSKGKKGNSPLRWVLRVIVIICTVALLLSYISIFVNPAKWWIPLFFGLYYIPICILNIALLIILILLKDRYLLIPLVALLPSLYFANMFLKIGHEERGLEGDEVRFMTYNVGGFILGEKGETQKETEYQITQFIEKEQAEIVCLQEFMTRDTLSLRNTFHQYPYIHFYPGKKSPFSGNITLSKYPIVSRGEVKFEGSANLFIYSDIITERGIVRVYNCHLESNRISFTSIIKRIADKGNIKDEVMGVHGKLRNSTVKRSSQVDAIVNLVNKSPYPSIICGDFNDTPLSYTYHQLAKNHKDSFIEGGSGFSSTYSGLWPILRIDYILIPEEFDADRHTVLRVPHSDHYPVRTTIYQTTTQKE